MPKKENRDSFVSFVIEPVLHRKLKEIAARKEMSTGALIRWIIKAWLKLNENKPKI